MTAIFALAAVLAAGAAAEEPVKTAQKPAQEISAAVRHSAPKGWRRTAYANGADPVLRYQDLSDEIVIRLFGGPGSANENPAAFLSGPGAASAGAPPAKSGAVKVAGREVESYTRRFPIDSSDPHGPSPAVSVQGTETFCVLPLQGSRRFAVLAWRRSSPAPDLRRRGEKAWEAFLKSVKLPPAKKL